METMASMVESLSRVTATATGSSPPPPSSSSSSAQNNGVMMKQKMTKTEEPKAVVHPSEEFESLPIRVAAMGAMDESPPPEPPPRSLMFMEMASKPVLPLEPLPAETPIRLSKLPIPARYPSRECAKLTRCCPQPPESWISRSGGHGWSGCGSYGIDIKRSIEIQQLARWFAPEVRLHSEEHHFPTEVDWYLARTCLKYRERSKLPVAFTRDENILNAVSESKQLSEATFQNIRKNRPLKRAGVHSHSDLIEESRNEDPGFYLTLLNEETRLGQPELVEEHRIPIYVHARRQPKNKSGITSTSGSTKQSRPDSNSTLWNDNRNSRGSVDTTDRDEDFRHHYLDIQYFFFYAYNGAVVAALPKAGIHEGDWEHITLRFERVRSTEEDKDYEYEWRLIGIWTDRHASEGRWYFETASSPVAGDGWQVSTIESEGYHPIIYCSLHGHTCYVTAGRQSRFVPFGVIDDRTDDGGMRWLTWKNIVFMGELYDDAYIAENKQWWLRYLGKWGKFGNGLTATGPVGPGVKRYYAPCSDGDEPPTSANSVISLRTKEKTTLDAVTGTTPTITTTSSFY